MDTDASANILEELKCINSRLGGMDEKFNSIDKKFDNMNIILNEVCRSTTIMETEHGRKIDIILELYDENTKKHKFYDEKLSSHDNNIDIHTWEIDAIKNKIS